MRIPKYFQDRDDQGSPFFQDMMNGLFMLAIAPGFILASPLLILAALGGLMRRKFGGKP